MELQDIVRRLRMGQSIKAIKRETGKHRRVIRRLLLLAEQEGWLDEQDEVPSEQQLQEVALLIGGTTRYRPISHGRVRSIVHPLSPDQPRESSLYRARIASRLAWSTSMVRWIVAPAGGRVSISTLIESFCC